MPPLSRPSFRPTATSLCPILVTTTSWLLSSDMLPLVISNGTGAAANRSIGSSRRWCCRSLCLPADAPSPSRFSYSYFQGLSRNEGLARSSTGPGLLAPSGTATAEQGGRMKKLLSFALAVALQFGDRCRRPAGRRAPARIGITVTDESYSRQAIEKAHGQLDQALVIARIDRSDASVLVTGAKGIRYPAGFTANRTRAVTPVGSLFGGAADSQAHHRKLPRSIPS